MKKTFIVLTIFISVCFSQSRKGSIKGVVKTSDGHPVELVNVTLKESSKGDVTNSRGEYEIINIDPGIYEVGISFMGYQTTEYKTDVKAGETTIIPDIYLKETAKQLHEITILGDRRNKFAEVESKYVSKLPIKNIENPQSYSITTQKLLKEENINSYSSALKTIPGGVISAENPQGLSAVFIRGFQANSFLRNGLYNFSWNGGDPQVMDKIELIKGPSGAVYGTWGVSYGGLINIVTKKPFGWRYFQGGLTLGSYNLMRFTGDFNTPLNEDKSLLFRLNAAVHSEGSFQDLGFKKSYLLAPALSFQINKKLNLLLEAEINSLNFSAQSMFNGAPGLNVKSIDQVKRNYFQSYSSLKLDPPPGSSNNYFGQINFDISEKWKLSTNFASSGFAKDGSNIFLNFLNDSLLVRQLYDYNFKINNINVQPNLSGEFFISGFKNRFLAGLDYQWIDVSSAGSFVFSADTINYLKKGTPVLNVNKLRNNYNFSINTYESRNSYAAYLSDFISLPGDFILMLSLRYDYNDYNGLFDRISGNAANKPYLNDEISPQAGLTYELIPNRLSLYINYMQGFNYVPPDIVGNSFSPEYAEQVEAGFKMNLFSDRLYSTISFYNISVKNKVHPDRSNPPASIQNGTQLSRGVDVDLRANPAEGLNIIAGYENNFSKFTEGDKAIEGKRPLGTPTSTANLWTSYIFQYEPLTGLGLGLGFIYSSDYFYDDANLLVIPGYLVLKGNIFYEARQFRISLLVDNFTDKRYWDFNGTPQMPQTYQFSIDLNLE